MNNLVSSTVSSTIETVDASHIINNKKFITGSIDIPYYTDLSSTNFIKSSHDEIAELRDMIERLKGKPYYMKIQCHNCGAPLSIESSNHLIKCKYCHTAYFSGTQLVNSI